MGCLKAEKIAEHLISFFSKLPGGGKKEIGAAYTAAFTALFATLIFAFLGWSVGLLIGDSGVWIAGFSIGSLPFVVPSASVAAYTIWKVFPEYDQRFSGAISGTLATILTYILASLLVFIALVISEGDLIDPVMMSLIIGVTAFFLTSWLTVPIGAACGYAYNQMRTEILK